MKNLLLVAALAFTLVGCGNETERSGLGAATSPIKALLQRGGTPPVLGDPNDPAIRAGIVALREGFQKTGQPLINTSNATLKYGALMAPFGGNNGVATWSSTGYQTASFRDGVLASTRGFGPDLMSSIVPTIATIAAARGTTQRRYSYLDGADQPFSLDVACTLAAAGNESIEIFAKPFMTRKVTETCAGPSVSFTNVYWFDKGINVRQSKQFFAPGLDTMFIQRVID